MSPNRNVALAVAPMMGKVFQRISSLLCRNAPPSQKTVHPSLLSEYTDRHYRYFARLLSRKVELYTEMVVDQTILHQRDNLDRFLGFHPAEHPVGKRVHKQPLHLR